MANKKLKGLVVELGLDGSNLKKGLSDANKDISKTFGRMSRDSKALKQVGDTVGVLQTKTRELDKVFNKQYKTLTTWRNKVDAAGKELKKLDNQQKESKVRTDKLREAYDISVKSTSERSKNSKELKKQLEAESKTSEELAKSVDATEKQYKEYNAEMEHATRLSKSYGKQLSDSKRAQLEYAAMNEGLAGTLGKMGDKAHGLGEKLTDVGKKATMGLTVPLAGGFTLATKKAIDFDSQMTTIQALLRGNASSTKELNGWIEKAGDSSKYWAMQYGIATSDINEGMEEVIKKGFDFDQTMGMMPSLLDASVASGDDFNTVMGVTTSTIEQFNLKSDDYETQMKNAARVTDTLTFVANETASGFADMGSAMEYVGPVSESLGISVEETASAIGLLSNNGIEGEKAGTALRGALTRLLKPSKQNIEGFEKLGISSQEFLEGTMSLPDMLDRISNNTKGWNKEQRASAIALAFGTEAQTGMNILVNQGGDALRDLTKESENANGYTSKLAEEMGGSSAKKIDKFKQSLEVLGIEIGDKLVPKFTPFVEKATELIQSFSKLDDKTQQAIINAGLLAMSAGPVMRVSGGVAKGFGNIFEAGQKVFAGKAIAKVTKNTGIFKTALNGVKGAGSKLARILPGVGGAATVASGEMAAMGGTATIAAGETATLAGAAGAGSGGLTAVLGVLSGPVGIIAGVGTAIGLLGKSFVDEKIHSDEFKESMASLKTGFSDFTTESKQNLTDWWEGSKELLSQGNPFAKISDSTKVLSASIDEETKKSLDSYIKLETGVNEQLDKLRNSNTIFNQKNVTDILASYDTIANEAVSKIEERKIKEMAANRELLQGVEGVTQEERQKSQQNIDTWYVKQEQDVIASQERIQGILKTAAEEKRTLTLEEYSEIDRIQNEMNATAVTALSESHAEQKVILERMKNNKVALSAEAASKVIKDSVEQKDKTIAAASEERDKTIKEAVLEAEKGQISDETKTKIITNAENQYKKSVKRAKNMHDETVKEMQMQNSDIKSDIDVQTGKIKTKWDKFSEGFVGISKKLGKGVKGLWNGMMTKVEKDTTDGSKSMRGQWDQNEKNISKNSKTATTNAKKEFENKMPKVANETERHLRTVNSAIKDSNKKVSENSKQATDNAKKEFEGKMPKVSKTTKDNASLVTKDWHNMTKSIAEDSKKGTEKSSSAFGWVMELVGGSISKKAFPWSAYEKGTGTGGHKGGHALINDQKGSKYKELVISPNGQIFMPKQRNVLIPNMPKGTEVVNATDTETLQRSGVIPYAKGSGGFFSGLVDKAKGAFQKVKDWSMDIWDWVADKTKIKQLMASKIGKLDNKNFKFNNDFQNKMHETILENSSSKILTEAESMGGDSFDGAISGNEGLGAYKYIYDIAKKAMDKFGNLRVTSGYRPGDPYSHGSRQAIDIAHPPSMNGSPENTKVADWVFNKFRKEVGYVITNGRVRDRSGKSGTGVHDNWTRWTDGDHYDHIHINGMLEGSSNKAGVGPGSGGWRSKVKQASQMMNAKATPSEIDGILAQIQRESTGNEKITQSTAVWDINAQTGNLAKGLLQYVPSTFNSYKVKGFENIFNGFHQLMAFFNNSNWRHDLPYGRSGWGPSGSRIKGYKNGGLVTNHQLAEIAEGNKPEMVLPLTKKARAIALINKANDMMGVGPNSDSTIANILEKQNEKIDKLIDIVQYLALNTDKKQPIFINGKEINARDMSEGLETLNVRGRFNLNGG